MTDKTPEEHIEEINMMDDGSEARAVREMEGDKTPEERAPRFEEQIERGMTRWAIDDHIVNKGDGKGRWYLYDLHEFNDGPPCAEFYEESVAREVCSLLNKAESNPSPAAVARVQGVCMWSTDGDDIWETTCSQAHQFFEGGPEENFYKWCPYCGKTIEAMIPESER